MTKRWLKYRTRLSSGPGQWCYRQVDIEGYVSEEAALKDFVSDLNYELSTDSEHWRGVEGVFVHSPPLQELEAIHARVKKTLKDMQDWSDSLAAELCRRESQEDPYSWVWGFPWREVDVRDPGARKAREKYRWRDRAVRHAARLDDDSTLVLSQLPWSGWIVIHHGANPDDWLAAWVVEA